MSDFVKHVCGWLAIWWGAFTGTIGGAMDSLPALTSWADISMMCSSIGAVSYAVFNIVKAIKTVRSKKHVDNE